jgi:ribokinase
MMSTTFAPPSVTVLGSVNIDTVLTVARFPAPGETVIATSRVDQLGGKGANQAAAAARLGAATIMVGAVGDDAHGGFARRALSSAGVDPRHLQLAQAPTGSAAITVDDDGENQIVVHSGANEHLTLPSELPDSDVLLCQLEIRSALVEQAVEAARGFVCINAAPAVRLHIDAFRRADLIVVNSLEWEALSELVECDTVIVTEGESGASLYRRGTLVERVPAVRADVVNTVGAGDAYTAAVTLGIAGGLPAVEAMRVAASVGAFAVSVPESQPPLGRWADYAS